MTEARESAASSNRLPKRWKKWAILFVPAWVLGLILLKVFGFAIGIGFMTAALASFLLFQRIVKRRPWSSILWGDRHDHP